MNKITIFIYFKRRALLYGLMLCFFAIYTAKAGTTYTATGGNWSNNSSWSPSTGHPVAGDIAIIPKAAANKITVDVNSTCANVQMGVSGSGGIASLTFSPGVTLTITGSLDFESGVGGTVTVNKGILNVGTSVTVPTSNSAYKITVTTGSAILNTAAHTLTIPASATGVLFRANGTGSMTYNGPVAISAGVIENTNASAKTTFTNTVTLDGTGIIENNTRGTINFTGTSVTLNSTITSTDGILGSTGAITFSSTTSITQKQGTISVSSGTLSGGSTVTQSGGTIKVASTGSMSFSGAVTQSAGTITIANSSASITFNGLVTQSAAGTGTISSTSSGTYNFKASPTAYIIGTGNTFSTNGTENINFGGSFTNSGTATFTAASTTTFTASSTVTPTAAISFGNLAITAGTLTLAGNISVQGNWTDAGTLTGNYGVTLNGTTTQTITDASGETFYTLTLTGTGTIQMANNIIVSNELDMSGPNINLNSLTLTLGNSSGAKLTQSAAASLAYGGTFKRYWPVGAISSSTGNLYGLFPIAPTSSLPMPILFNSSSNTTSAGYVSAINNNLAGVIVNAYTDNVGNNIAAVSSENTTVTTTGGQAGGTFQVSCTFEGFVNPGSASDADYHLETYNSGVFGFAAGTTATEVSCTGAVTAPTIVRSGLTVISNEYVCGTSNINNSPIVNEYFSRPAVAQPMNWSTASNWSATSGGGGVGSISPTGIYIIQNGTTVNVNATENAASVTVQNGGALKLSSSLTISGNLVLNGTGAITGSSNASVGGNVISTNTSSVNTTGSWGITGSLILNNTSTFTSGASTTISGGLQIDNGTTLTMNSAASLTLSGNIILNGTLALGTSTAAASGVGQTLSGTTGTITGASATLNVATNNLTINSGTVLTIGPTFKITGATTVFNYGNITLTGNLTGTSASSTWQQETGSSLHAAGTVLTTGTLDPSSCGCSNTIEYNASGAQTISAPIAGGNYSSLLISNSGTKTLPAASTITVTTTLNLSGSVILDESTSVLTDNGGAANLVMSGTSELKLTRAGDGVTTFPELNGVYTIASGTGIYIDNTVTGAGNAAVLNGPAAGSTPFWDVYLTEATVAGQYDLSDGGAGDIEIGNNLYVQGKSVLATVSGGLQVDNLFDYTSSGSTTLDDDLTAGNVTINGTGTLNDGGNNIFLTGAGAAWNLTAGTYTATGLVEFEGSGAQSITGATTFFNLTLNTAAANNKVTINNPISVNDVLTLTQGALLLNSNTLTVNNSITSAIVSTSGYIISDEAGSGTNTNIVKWVMGATTGNFIFPFGTLAAGTLIPFTFNKTTATPSTVSVSTRATGANNTPLAAASDGGAVAAVANLDNITTGLDESSTAVVDRWWDIQSSAAVTANLTFSYDGVENTTTISPTGTFAAQHWNGTSWDAAVGTGTGVNTSSSVGTVTVNGVSTFSPWVVVTSNSPLPISLVSFTATCDNYYNLLQWKTSSEINNDHFTIDKTQDGEHFQTFTVVKGAGNSSTERNYEAIDDSPFPGISYYRLSQTDVDGSTTRLSTIVYVSCENEESIDAYSSANNIIVQVNSNTSNSFRIMLTNTLGQVVFTQTKPISEGSNTFKLNPQVQGGVYLLQIVGNNKVFIKKIIL